MSSIKNIVFDLGVVLFDLDYDLTVKAFEKLGIDNHEELFSEAGQLGLFDQFERGEIGIPEFLEGMNTLLPSKVEDELIVEAWNAMLLTFPQSSIDLLVQLRKHYNLDLLSNTNDLHFEKFHEIINKQHGLLGLDEFFSALYYSHREGLRKPEPEFYERLIEREDLTPSETLFIDDMIRNVHAANKVGMRGCHLEKGSLVTELFDVKGLYKG